VSQITGIVTSTRIQIMLIKTLNYRKKFLVMQPQNKGVNQLSHTCSLCFSTSGVCLWSFIHSTCTLCYYIMYR